MEKLDSQQPSIPESLFEHRQIFQEPWIEKWITPNPFLSRLAPALRPSGVGLGDFSFNINPANVSEAYLHIAIRRFNAAVRIGLDYVRFSAVNPNWGLAPGLVPAFDQISDEIRAVVGAAAKSQEATLAFHVTPGALDFGKTTASLVNSSIAGPCLFYGVSFYKSDRTLLIDKSVRYEGAAFVRLQRTFGGESGFADVITALYEAELTALNLLGIPDVPS